MNFGFVRRTIVAAALVVGSAVIAPSSAVGAGITGLDVYVINSNGVRCGQDCVSQSQAQVALCIRGAQSSINFVDMSYGYTLRKGATVISSRSYPDPGVRFISGLTCANGYYQTWDFRDLIAGETYEVEAWMIDDAVSYTATLSITTAAAIDPSTTTTINPLSTSTTIAVDALVPGVPQIDMYEGPSVGAWNLVDNATGQVMNTAVCTPAVCGRNGEWRTWPSNRLLNNRYWPTGYPEGATYIWNPIGAGSGGRYYTNGLYVTNWGQHILPGTSSLVAVVSPPTTVPAATSDNGAADTTPVDSSTTTSTTTTVPVVNGAQTTRGVMSAVGLTEVGLSIEQFGNQYSISITSPLRNSAVVVKATAKGKPTISWSTKTNINAQKILLSSRSLKGYTVSLWVNGRKLSSVKAN